MKLEETEAENPEMTLLEETKVQKMEKIQFKTTIKGRKEGVWEVLWGDTTYQKWTSVFGEGSHAESDWNEGSRVLFLDGKGNGMYSVIARKIENEYMSFKHLGSIEDGKEIPFAGEMASWSEAQEDYTLVETDGFTELTVELDTEEEFKAFMTEKFPLALAKVKEFAEEANA